MTNKEILDQAIEKATAHGWVNTVGYTVIDIVGCTMLRSRDWPPQYLSTPNEMIFEHDFAKALWGDEEVDNNGWPIKAIRIWANQVAVKHGEKIYDVDPKRQFGAIVACPEIDWQQALEQPDSLVNVDKVEYELKRMTASIPFETHRLEALEIESESVPAWQYHLQNMVVAEDPIKYLGDNL